MRKFLLLCFTFTISLYAQAQKDTVLLERFDPPSGADLVTNGSLTPTTNEWDITTTLAASEPNSYHVKATKTIDTVYFETDPFSTVGKPYVALSFNHIAKLYVINQARIQISVDGGATWEYLNINQYKGNDQVFNAAGWFNSTSHVNQSGTITPWQPAQPGAIPDDSWWRSEFFDLTGRASDASTMTGYPDVRLRFMAIFRASYNAPQQPSLYSDGWYIDDIVVTAGPCEQNPPTFSFDYDKIPCYIPLPQGAFPATSDSCVEVGAVVEDVMATYDTGVDSVAVFYRVNNGPFQHITLPDIGLSGGAGNEHKDSICGIGPGDTIDYYLKAWDLSCPANTSRRPSELQGYNQFYIEQALPLKCGDPNCGFLEVIRPQPTWSENFDNTARWDRGTGNGNSGTGHRGDFPTFPDGAWKIGPPANTQYGGFGWSIVSGATGTPFTGPDDDHTLGAGGGGQYIYLETSQNAPPSGNSRLTTPCIDLTQSTTCKALEFYYHMFGDNIGELRVFADTGSNTSNLRPDALIKIIGEQQSSGSDPWKRAIIPLTEFNGQIIQLVFFGYKGNGARGDIALDDFRIYEPNDVEMEVLASDYPENGYCDYGMEEVNIHIRNNGCATANDIPVAYSLNGGPPIVETITGANLELGEDTNYVFSTLVDLSPYQLHNLKVWVAMPGDIDTENDTIVGPTIENFPAITTFPYVMDFEDGTPGTKNLGTTDMILEDGLDPSFHWQVGHGLTPTRGTGPYSGHYFGGNYLYTTTISPAGGATSTYLRTVCVDLTGLNNPTLDFLFHNYTDAGFDKVEVEVSQVRENSETWSTVPGSNVASKTSSEEEFSNWVLKRVDLSDYKDSIVKLRFKATRTNTSSSEINFAIDNIAIYDLIPQDGGVLNIRDPFKKGSLNSDLDPKVAVVNYGSGIINGFTLNLEVTPLCGPDKGQTTLYTQTYTNTIQPAQNQVVTMNSPNIDWPRSECRVCFYPTVSGDTYAFNDTVCKNIVVRSSYDIPAPDDPTIDAFNFDDCDYSKDGLFPEGDLLQWELGSPTYGVSARTAPNSWVTDLDNPYLVGTTEYLYLPRFSNFDTIVSAQIRFYHKFNFGNVSNTGIFDAAGTLQYYDDNSNAYKILGADRITFNEKNIRGWWSDYALSVDLFDQRPGWVGSTGQNYRPSWYRLSEFNYANSNFELDMRFVFKSKDVNQGAASYGWSIDDFQIYVPPQNSVSPIRVRYDDPLPFPYTDQTLRLWIQNTGAKVVDDYEVEVLIDGVSLGTEPRNINNSVPGISQFREGVIRQFAFTHKWPASMATPGTHEVCVITSRPNSKQDNLTIDDTLCVEMVILQEFDMTSIGDSVYCNDFEGTDPDITDWLTTNTDPFAEGTSWEEGFPQQVDSAHSGFYVWMTNLDSNYTELDASALYTPVFIVDSGLKYQIDFHHWFQTEKHHDGGNVEVSYDEGYTWYPIGYSVRKRDTIGVYKNNWFNTPFVTALDQIKGGWTDTSGGWMNSFWRMTFMDDVRVVFRFRFGSDYSVHDAGWAIDDFCFHKTDESDQDIGQDEFTLPDEIMIGELAPNPARDQTQLAFHFPTPNDMKITVYNVVGQLVESRENRYQEGVHLLDFDTSNWKNGIYLINLEYEGQSVTKKLVVSH